MKAVRFFISTLVLYACVILLCFIYIKVRQCAFASTDRDEIVVSGNFFNAFHEIISQIQDNTDVKRVIYVLSADDIVDKQEMFSNDDYVEYLVGRNFAFLSWQDWKFLLRNNLLATVKGVIATPFSIFLTPSYTKTETYNSGTASPEYLYSMINYCNDNEIILQAVALPNPGKINTRDVEASVDLMQHYVGGVLDYSDVYVPSKYLQNKILTEEGKDMVLKPILSNINGVHSKEYVELNKIENIKKDSPILQLIEKSSKVVFVGNSITDGCNNGGYGWYESLMAALPDVKVGKVAYGGITTKELLDKVQEIVNEKGDLYVFASGCNDIKVGNPDDGAVMYINYLQTIVDRVTDTTPSARFVFVAPWQRWPETEVECIARPKYTMALEEWCKAHGHVFANPNPEVDAHIRTSKYFSYYMVDRTHPNSSHGMKLYSEAVVNSAYDFHRH